MLQFFPVGSVSDTIKTNLESNVKKRMLPYRFWVFCQKIGSKNLVLWKLAVQQKTCIRSRHDHDFGKSIYTFAFIYKVRIGILWKTVLHIFHISRVL